MRKRESSILHLQSAICNARSRERAQAIVEYAIVFPIQLLVTLAIIQLAYIFVAKQVLEYGAFCAARSALVASSEDWNNNPAKVQDDAKKAAVIPIAAIAGPSGVTTSDMIDIPGWGTLQNSGAAAEKTQVIIAKDSESGSPVISCELTHHFELHVPVGNLVAYKLGDVLLGADNLDTKTWGTPHLKMTASCRLAQPWEE